MLLDEYGLIVSRDWAGGLDSGDSLAETSRISFLKKLCGIEDKLESFLDLAPFFKNQDGQLIRSPYRWTDPLDCSRDQIDPYIMCLAIYGMEEQLHNEALKLLKWWAAYPNGDFASPEHALHSTRHRPLQIKWPGDLFMLLNAFIICFIRPKRVENDLNHIISLCHAEYFGGTFISRMAARLYLKRRDYVKALLTYYTPETGNGDLVKYYLQGLQWLRGRIQC